MFMAVAAAASSVSKLGMSAKASSLTCVDGGRNHTISVHVDDATQLYLLAAQKNNVGELFNASTNTELTAKGVGHLG